MTFTILVYLCCVQYLCTPDVCGTCVFVTCSVLVYSCRCRETEENAHLLKEQLNSMTRKAERVELLTSQLSKLQLQNEVSVKVIKHGLIRSNVRCKCFRI